MLRLLLGRAGSGKTTAMLRAAARNGGERRQLILVPEQASHDTERALCAVAGNQVSLYAEVLSFTRLASRVFSQPEVGGVAVPTLDPGGRLLPPEDVPDKLRNYMTTDADGNGVFHLTDRVYLTAGDVRALQLAKAAVAAGAKVLLARQGLTLSELDGIYLAGGFGMYLDPGSAAAIGLLPQVPQNKLHSVGNAALAGASALVLDTKTQEAAARIAERCQYIELSGQPDFADAFAGSMTLEPIQRR